MANVIKLKFSSETAAPTTLLAAEPAYSQQSGILYIGDKDGAVIPIGGKSFMDKLAGIEAGATGDMTGSEMKTAIDAVANTNFLTDAEKSKLAGLESSKYRGLHLTIEALQTAVTDPVAGDYADVDAGVGKEVTRYIWDSSDNLWRGQAGTSTAETAASVKEKYESNPDTNAFTDALLAKLQGVEANATGDMSGAEIKTAYEAQANTNAFTDSLLAKLNAVEANATGDMTAAEIKSAYESVATAYSAAEKTKLAGIEEGAQVNLTAAEMVTAIGGEDNINFMSDAEKTKLSGIEAGAQVNLTAAQTKSALEGIADTNFVTDAQQTLLVELEAGNGVIDGGSF